MSADLALPQVLSQPTFAAPWQAQAFAMTLKLHERGVFTWNEWAAALTAELKEHQDPAQCGDDYYHCWVEALETLIEQKGLTSHAQLDALTHAWEQAVERTPHGEPVALAVQVLELARNNA
jgi:nitrile hydratase accessory protein